MMSDTYVECEQCLSLVQLSEITTCKTCKEECCAMCIEDYGVCGSCLCEEDIDDGE